jgi:hypothetical protein
MANGQTQQRYLDILGVKRGATMDEIHTAYYLLIEKYAHNPTEDEAEEQLKLQHAYNILCRSYEEPEERSPAHTTERSPKLLLKIAGALLVLGIPGLVAMNYSALKLRMADVEPGTVVRLKDSNAPYGTILRYDPAHQFHTGEPTPAYEIRLRNGEETVWLSKRVVVKGMVAVDPARPEKPIRR